MFLSKLITVLKIKCTIDVSKLIILIQNYINQQHSIVVHFMMKKV